LSAAVAQANSSLNGLFALIGSFDENSDYDTVIEMLVATQSDVNSVYDYLKTTIAGQLSSLATSISELPENLKKAFNLDETVVAKLETDLDEIIKGYVESAADSDEYKEIMARFDEVVAEIKAIDFNAIEASQVVVAQESAYAEIDAWIGNYVEELYTSIKQVASLNGDVLVAYAEDETSETIVVSTQAVDTLINSIFNETNAALVRGYYVDALTSIETAESVTEVEAAVTVFKTRVQMVQVMQNNDESLSNAYLIIIICIACTIVALCAAVVLWRIKNKRQLANKK
jgi:hypothetical protein